MMTSSQKTDLYRKLGFNPVELNKQTQERSAEEKAALDEKRRVLIADMKKAGIIA